LEKYDVLLRAETTLRDLYTEINCEDWTNDEELYKKQMDDLFIISNALESLSQYRYNKTMTKKNIKSLYVN